MRLWILFSLITAFLMTGCGDPTGVRRAPTEGVTLADLRPEVAEKPVPVILFGVTTYLVDAAHLKSVQSCYKGLPGRAIRFLDKKAFEANGFLAGRGTGMQFSDLNACLVLFGAKRLGQATLLLNAGTEVQFSEAFIDHGQTIPYAAAGGVSTTVSLQSGTLGWWLMASPDPAFPRRVNAKVLPVFTPKGLLNWPSAEQYALKMTHRFEEGGFEVLLGEGDFVALGAKEDSMEALSTLQRLLFLQPDSKPMMKLYVIYCVKAKG